MQSLTPARLRASFVNTSRREASQAIPPFSLDEPAYPDLELLGWSDRHNPQRAFVVIPLDEREVGIQLRAVPGPRRKAMCALCEDITEVSDVKMFVAKLAGPAGRRGDTLGTLIHADFSCSRHVRRQPSRMEGQDDPQGFIERRVAQLRENAERFARRVLGEEKP